MERAVLRFEMICEICDCKDGTDVFGRREDMHIVSFLQEEDAVGVVEIILILVVLISLVIIFKKQLTSLVNSILSKITTQSNSI